jgi:hypothetical protein
MFKKLLAVVAITVVTSTTFAAKVRSARLDQSKQNILIDVTYGGGCGEHKFTLKVGGCLESAPVQCGAQLIEETDDYCEGLIGETISISLQEAGLTGAYYSNASLTIFGDLDSTGNERTQANITLP